MSAIMAREFPKKSGTAFSTSFIVDPPEKRSRGPASALPRCRRSPVFTAVGPGRKRPPEAAAPSGWNWQTARRIRGSQSVEVLTPGRGSIGSYTRKGQTGTMLIQAGAQLLIYAG